MFDFLKRNKKDNEMNVTEFDLYAMVDGQLIMIDEVKDPVFAQKMMGDGFAFIPDNGDVQAPCQGEVLNVFPSKHAIALKYSDVEILLHFGIDTVALDGLPFDVKVQEGDMVSSNTKLIDIDLQSIKDAEKDDVVIVIFTNGNETIENLVINEYGPVSKGDLIGKVILK